MPSIEVLLADDHPVVRAGVRSLLEAIEGVKVIGEAENGREAVRLAIELRPDIIFMDITMPELNGLEAAEMVRRDAPDVRVIMLSVHSNVQYAIRALKQVGASGYLKKDARPEEFKAAIRAVTTGGVYVGPDVARLFISHIRDSEDQGANPLARLTLRQREIVQLIAEGKRNKDIAAILNVSVKTVESHRANVMEMLDIHDIAGLVKFAIRTGLASADE
ncbi:MAG: response regulator transcription factor [Rhodothermales bacterium]|nr:response regulator transcription factor [Rhodothermales bacterium]